MSLCVYVKEKYAIYIKHSVRTCSQLVSEDSVNSVVLGANTDSLAELFCNTINPLIVHLNKIEF